MSTTVTMYLAVLPSYRTRCIELVRSHFGDSLTIYVSSAHLDPSVKTGIPNESFTEVPMFRMFGRAFVQLGGWLTTVRSTTAILDLNPRSITSWILLISRRILGKRTLLWGHVNPQRGLVAKSAGLRGWMRRLSDGVICYTYEDQRKVQEVPSWVAPNAIYREIDIGVTRSAETPTSVIYVGRFSPQKKVELLVRAFVIAQQTVGSMRLLLVGDGTERAALEELAHELGVREQVEFVGWMEDVSVLRSLYSRAFCSVSPGFAGLGLTQSLGFGVPQLVATDEPHSPEIELAATGGVTWFPSDRPDSLGAALLQMYEGRELVPVDGLSDAVRASYSAERMASGIIAAIEDSRYQGAAGG